MILFLAALSAVAATSHVIPIHPVGPGNPLLYVEATLNGVPGRKLILDTGNGSEHMLVSRAEAGRFSIATKEFHSKHKSFAVGSDKIVASRLGNLASLTVGDITIKNWPILVSESVDKLASSSHSDFCGVLGYSFFKDYALSFDYKAMTLTLDQKPKPPHSSVPFTLKSSTPLILLDVPVEGQGIRRFVVDTGAGADVISREMMKDLKLKSMQQVTVKGAKGSSQADLVRIPALTFAGHSFQPPYAVAADFVPDLGKVLGVHLDGVIGQTTLRHYRFTVDYIHNRIWAESAEAGS
jgi:predicted aspartyl protease